jgi:hypothetical protein
MGKSRTAAAFALDRVERGQKVVLVVTKDAGNVANLMEKEFPPIFGETKAKFVLLSGETMPEVKAGKSPVPRFEEPTVYFINSYQFQAFGHALAHLPIETVIVDEVHLFKNDDHTKTGTAWVGLHKQWVGQNVGFMYLSATPAIDLMEMRYLYGLKVWTPDGFNDWLGVITGKLSPEQAKAKVEAVKLVAKYQETLKQAAGAALEQAARVENGKGGAAGYKFGDYVSYMEGLQKDSGDVFVVGRYGMIKAYSGDANMAALIARELGERYQGGAFRPGSEMGAKIDADDAADAVRAKYPPPEIPNDVRTNLGSADGTDLIDALLDKKGKNKFGAKRTAFESTLPPEHTEQIMRELKLAGSYMSRDIARNGVDFQMKELALTPEQRARHNERIALYRDLMKLYKDAAKADERKRLDPGVVGFLQADAKRALFDLRLENAMPEIDAAIKNGEQVVISVVSVSEDDPTKGGNLRAAINKINHSRVEDLGEGAYTDPVDIPEILIAKAELQERAEKMKLADPIALLEKRYGTRIKFVTGDVPMKQRAEAMRAFQNNRLDAIVISGAGKTGINLHDITGKKRMHLMVIDYDWSATEFKQELGRVDRTGQKSSPKVTIYHMNSAGELKFLATISNRMKGLGATSKGGAESTGTGAMNEQFELGSTYDKVALAETWTEMDRNEKEMFLDSYFKSGNQPKANLEQTANSIKKFTMALQTMPLEIANDFMGRWMQKRAKYTADEAADLEAKKQMTRGEVLRSTRLSNNVTLTEVRDGTGHRFGVVSGVLTPEMAKLAEIFGGDQSEFVNGEWKPKQWRQWVNFTDAANGEKVSGLIIPVGKIEDVAKRYGKSAKPARKPETALRDLHAGDKLPILGVDLAEWQLYMGKGGAREGKIIVEGGRMAHRDALMRNGARYDGRGFWFVPEERLQDFLKRFPLRTETETPKEGEALYDQGETGGQKPPAVNAPLGTSEQLQDMPAGDAMLEGYYEHVQPLMGRIRSRLSEGPQVANTVQDLQQALPPQTMTKLRRWAAGVYADLADNKLAATQWSKARRDMTLLDYTQTTKLDKTLQLLMPYEFWYSRSALNWALRALERPSIVANYLRMKNIAQSRDDRQGVPSRLRGKMFIPLPFLPKWMGPGVFVDPLRQAFPFEQMVQPWENRASTQNQIMKRASGILDDMVKNEEISAGDGMTAMQTRSGAIWERAYAQAELENENMGQATMVGQESGMGGNGAMIGPGPLRDTVDMAFNIMSPQLPIGMAWNAATGRSQSQLPITRFVQNVTQPTGLGGPRGFQITRDRFDDYKEDRMLANMAGEGVISADQAVQAMIERKGQALEEAQRRVGQMGQASYWLSSLSLDFFPEGEEHNRQLYNDYKAAVQRKLSGADPQAINKFYDQYPEYEARQASFRDPQQRLRQYLISSIWDGYGKLNGLNKQAAGEQLGELFGESFLNKATRSYDAIDTDTLTYWARILGSKKMPGQYAPGSRSALDLATGQNAPQALNGQQGTLKGAPANVSKLYDQYQAEKAQKFPDVDKLYKVYGSGGEAMRKVLESQTPQIAQYNQWRTGWLADHPELVPYVVGPESKISGAPAEVQKLMYQYWAQRDRQYPGIDKTQEKYFSFADTGAKRDYLDSHPELSEYWTWRRQFSAANPATAPYIFSTETLSSMILGEQNGYAYKGGGSNNVYAAIAREIPAKVRQAVLHNARSGISLSMEVMETKELKKRYGMSEMSDDDFWRTILPSIQGDTHPQVLTGDELKSMPPELLRSWAAHLFGGAPLGEGAYAETQQQMQRLKIGEDVDTFIDVYVRPALAGVVTAP